LAESPVYIKHRTSNISFVDDSDWLDASSCHHAELSDVRDLLIPVAHSAELGFLILTQRVGDAEGEFERPANTATRSKA